MPITRKSEGHPGTVFTGRAVAVLLVLAVVTADVASISVILGLFSLWQAVVAVFTVLSLSAGSIWTILVFCQTSQTRPQPRDPSNTDGETQKDVALGQSAGTPR